MVRKEAKKVVLKDAEGSYIVPVIDPADKGGGYTPNIFDIKWSDHLQNDIRWLRGDTFSWQPGTVYEAAYNKLVQEYDDTSSVVTVNASKVGAVNLSDNGIASGFTTTAYLSKAITLSSDRTNVFPMRFSITTGGDITTDQYIAGIDGWCMQLSIGTDSKFHLYLGSGSSWDIANGTAGQTVLSANTNYELVLDYDGNEYTLQVITNGSTPTVVNDIVLASTTMICTGARNLYIGTNDGHTVPFLGTINVPGCSIDNSWHGTFSKTSKNGFVILDSMQEQYAIQRFTNEGVAWYYILDKTNQRFKLPRTKYGFVGLRDSVGGYVPESLPNITGSFSSDTFPRPVQTTGSFYDTSYTGTFRSTGTENVTANGLRNFDASRSSSTYQDNAPVQQRATQMYLYFYVGDYTQTAVEQTAGLNAELFNGKVDLNFNNMNPSQTAKNTIVEWGTPDYTAGVDVGVYNSSSNQFTAPSAGIVYVFASIPSGGRPQIYINDVLFSDLAVGGSSFSLNNGIQIVLGKGDKYYATQSTLEYAAGANKFYPLKGAK